MLITPLQLVDEPLEFDEAIAPGTLEYASDIRQVGPLPVKGAADLLIEHRSSNSHVNDIRLRAHYSADFEILCARCVDPVAVPLEGDFDLIFRPEGVDNQTGEHAITEDETEIGYYEESGLLLEDAVREQVLLNLPGRALCQQDCQGLCPHCGTNRNLASCDCTEKPSDPRWGALAAIAVGNKA